jgi:protein-S-isoprenylcysteine O-methyltransferase Ste14
LKPLVVHDGLAAAIFWTAAGAWMAGEMAFSIRTTWRSEGRRDPSFHLLTLTTLAALALGVLAAHGGSLTLPGPAWWPLAAGLAVLAAGLTLRIWAIRELGRFFTYAVLVHPGQRVIETGPYRRIRHPSYSGMVLGMLGLGLALGTWLSAAACMLPTLAAFSLRLRSEERVLATQLGEPYRDYMRRTRRLIPGLW